MLGRRCLAEMVELRIGIALDYDPKDCFVEQHGRRSGVIGELCLWDISEEGVEGMTAIILLHSIFSLHPVIQPNSQCNMAFQPM